MEWNFEQARSDTKTSRRLTMRCQRSRQYTILYERPSGQGAHSSHGARRLVWISCAETNFRLQTLGNYSKSPRPAQNVVLCHAKVFWLKQLEKCANFRKVFGIGRGSDPETSRSAIFAPAVSKSGRKLCIGKTRNVQWTKLGRSNFR